MATDAGTGTRAERRERASADIAPEPVQLLRREHTAPARLTPRDALELAKLREWVDPYVRVRADADWDATRTNAFGWKKAITEVGLGRRARADRRAGRREEVELGAIGVCRVDDGRPLAEAPGAGEELDRAAPVLCEAFPSFQPESLQKRWSTGS